MSAEEAAIFKNTSVLLPEISSTGKKLLRGLGARLALSVLCRARQHSGSSRLAAASEAGRACVKSIAVPAANHALYCGWWWLVRVCLLPPAVARLEQQALKSSIDPLYQQIKAYL